MPPAFVLSQDQTLHHFFLVRSFPSLFLACFSCFLSSLLNQLVLFVRFVSNCSIFKEPASRRRPLYYHLLPYLVNTFFLLFFLFFFTTFLHYFLFGISLLGLSLWLYRFSCRSFDRQRCLSYFFLHLLSIPFLHFLYSFFYFFQFNVTFSSFFSDLSQILSTAANTAATT